MYGPLTLITSCKFLLRQFEERLSHKSTTGIKYRSSKERARELLGDLVKSRLHAARVGQVCTDTDCLSATAVDFFYQGFIIGRIPR